ncbi:L,D-transpeptidase [Kaustia mangrovi]|uniref:L,D-transpeptidase n=1 Tax=Kaustia mangrovi TaxID=2593653 RepID=A0A7S8C3U2_9HYPH|nr:L,D-transpeptidase [Kaustia mangrovi]QPC42864.1 L,D-transpeptidase [Kaustia mangrovi]
MSNLDRRAVIAGLTVTAATGLTGCVTTASSPPDAGSPTDYQSMYAAITTEPFPIPAVDVSRMNPTYLRQRVRYSAGEQPGTIIVDPASYFLYHIEEGGWAMRYGVGVGREGFGWSGSATIKAKRKWPDWYPPKEMIEREPRLKKMIVQLQSGLGMPGGPRNPLGARALYLWQNNKDTLYRIHGTFEPGTIGRSVSSGCIRMINQDVIHLYNRTPIGTTVVVRSAGV